MTTFEERLAAEAAAMFVVLRKLVLGYGHDEDIQRFHGRPIPEEILSELTLRVSRDTIAEARAIYARIAQHGRHAHAGVWISDDDSDRISRDGP